MQKKKISIVAGDMVGFSRLIEENEINTLKRQKIIIKDIIEPKLGENNGKLIKTTGDGFLAVFENCDQSLSFSIEIQNQIIDQEKIIMKLLQKKAKFFSFQTSIIISRSCFVLYPVCRYNNN